MKKIPEFTEKQMIILDMVAEGLSIREIARILDQSEENIKQLRKRVRDSIGLAHEQDLRIWLYANGWEKPDMLSKEEEKLVLRTPNLNCPACKEKRRHEKWETEDFHPLAGTGFSYDRKLAGGH